MIPDSLNPFKQKPKVKVLGERNTATVYLEWLLRNNLQVDLLDYYSLGWKHRLAPGKEEIQQSGNQEVLFLCQVKNPYSWLLSMYRKPYGQEQLKELSFSEFIKFPFGDYRNPVVMWNIKNQSLINLGDYAKNHEIIRYEYLLSDPKSVLETIAVKYKLPESRHWFVNMDKYITNHHGISDHAFHKSYYLEEKWKHEYSSENLQFINSQLDRKLAAALYYEII